MLFNSYIFLIVFLPLAVVGYHSLVSSLGKRAGIFFLVFMSLVYYGWWNPPYVALLLASMVINFFYGIGQSRAFSRDGTGSKLRLTVGIAMNLGLLCYYKYANFFADNVNYVFGTHFTLGDVFLPLGISFFTFQQIAYLVDAYQGKTKEYDWVDYFLFVSFFPQLIAGPIVHHRDMLPQFADPRIRATARTLAVGVTLFIYGLFKKVILADTIAGPANDVFDAAAAGIQPDLLAAWGGALAYSLQLYFDFSGYSDMAIGIGQMFGIRLPMNFNSPYQAESVVQFWQRWHMTLSRFLRDYVYIPLGGNRCGTSRRYVNLMTTMLIGGFWHGASWTFVFWGGLHGFYLVVNHAWMALGERLTILRARALSPVYRIVTFLAVLVGWVVFRADSFATAWRMLAGMLGLRGVLLRPVFSGRVDWLNGLLTVRFGDQPVALYHWAMITAMIWIVFVLPNSQVVMRHESPSLGSEELNGGPRWRPSWAWACFTIGLGAISVLGVSRVSEFLYYQF